MEIAHVVARTRRVSGLGGSGRFLGQLAWKVTNFLVSVQAVDLRAGQNCGDAQVVAF